ncbi:hypothetical protein MKW98_002864 [Papaver atlanticum]|uniref:Uncharacterized protein n=1 Tax=Papaver atlanticum TaxID=357466 RepID=A0AAD4SWW8_9MAGN|nr:hypothetical protein MKW98_002864 [Papaver atlanticum]
MKSIGFSFYEVPGKLVSNWSTWESQMLLTVTQALPAAAGIRRSTRVGEHYKHLCTCDGTTLSEKKAAGTEQAPARNQPAMLDSMLVLLRARSYIPYVNQAHTPEFELIKLSGRYGYLGGTPPLCTPDQPPSPGVNVLVVKDIL